MRPRWLNLPCVLSTAAFAAAFFLADAHVLVYHRTAEGAISNIYPRLRQSGSPHQGVSRGYDIYYWYQANGETYRRTRPLIGDPEVGDEITVLYQPSSPGRHIPLTLFGLIGPVALLSAGVFFAWLARRNYLRERPQRRRRTGADEAGEEAAPSHGVPALSDAEEQDLTEGVASAMKAVLDEFRQRSDVVPTGWLQVRDPASPVRRSIYLVFDTDAALEALADQALPLDLAVFPVQALANAGYPRRYLKYLSMNVISREGIARDFGEHMLDEVVSTSH